MSRPFLRHWIYAQSGTKRAQATGKILFEQLQLPERGAGIDRLGGRFHARAQIRRQPRREQTSRRVHQDNIPARPR